MMNEHERSRLAHLYNDVKSDILKLPRIDNTELNDVLKIAYNDRRDRMEMIQMLLRDKRNTGILMPSEDWEIKQIDNTIKAIEDRISQIKANTGNDESREGSQVLPVREERVKRKNYKIGPVDIVLFYMAVGIDLIDTTEKREELAETYDFNQGSLRNAINRYRDSKGMRKAGEIFKKLGPKIPELIKHLEGEDKQKAEDKYNAFCHKKNA